MKILTVTPREVAELRDKLASVDRFGLDYETIPRTPQKTKDLRKQHALSHDLLSVLGVGFGFEDGSKTYIPIQHKHGDNVYVDDVKCLLSECLTDPNKECWAHNAKFEYLVSRTLGITPTVKMRCSLIAQWLLGYRLDRGRGYKLKHAVKHFLKHTMVTWEEVNANKDVADEVPPVIMGRYCGDDALQCLRLGLRFVPDLIELKLLDVFHRLEMEFMPVLVHMQEVGFELDSERLDVLHDKLSSEMLSLAREFEGLVGVGVTKNTAISRLMYRDLKWWPSAGFEKGKNGEFSIDKKHLEIVASKLEPDTAPMKALELKHTYQSVSKIASTYTVSLTDKARLHVDDRLRCDFNQALTETGRLSSSNPNLQNIPVRTELGRQIRDAFIAQPGWSLCVADYSQAELVIMAHLSQDPMLLKAYREGLDLHQQTADECSRASSVDVTRPQGKVTNLGLIYEMSSYRLSASLDIDLDVAESIWRAWHQTYPLVGHYHKRMHAFASKYGFVRTITGRIRRIPDINSRDKKKRSASQRYASNTPDQGSAADMIKIAKRNLMRDWQERGVLYDYYTKQGKAKIVSQVHDEIICELRDDFREEGMRDIRWHMENAVELRVPMTAIPGVGHSWNDAKQDIKRREKLIERAKTEVDVVLKQELLEESMRVEA